MHSKYLRPAVKAVQKNGLFRDKKDNTPYSLIILVNYWVIGITTFHPNEHELATTMLYQLNYHIY